MPNRSENKERTYLTEALATKEEKKHRSGRSIVARIFMIFGIVTMVAGLFGGFYFTRTDSGFLWVQAIYWCLGGLIGGMFFIGLGEIIRLLRAIYNQLST